MNFHKVFFTKKCVLHAEKKRTAHNNNNKIIFSFFVNEKQVSICVSFFIRSISFVLSCEALSVDLP